MAQIRQYMQPDPVILPESATVFEAASAMRERNIGAVLVRNDEEDRLCGIVTDRDLTVRCLGAPKARQDITEMPLGDVCSHELTSLTPDTEVDEAIRMMREHALRRIPVVEGDKAVGILSLGDLAVARDPDSVLGEISAAPPNA